MNLKEIFEMYKINSIKYTKVALNSLYEMNGREVHKLTHSESVLIKNIDIILNGKQLFLRDALVTRNNCNLKTNNAKFINVKFEDVKFVKSSLPNALFINCCFKNCVFTASSLKDVMFINCSFENTVINDLEVENVSFINCNEEEILDVFDKSIKDYEGVIINHKPEKELFYFLYDDENKENEIVANEKEKGEFKMNNNVVLNQEMSEIKLGYIYNECVFKNVKLTGMVDNRTQFINCKFKNVEFDSATFENVSFDGCIFTKAHIDECKFLTCTFIDASIDFESYVSSLFYKCNFLDFNFDCSKEYSNFDKSIFVSSNEKKNKDEVGKFAKLQSISTVDELIEMVEMISKFVKSNTFSELFNVKMNKENVLEYFSNLNDVEYIEFLSQLTTIRANKMSSNSTTKENHIEMEDSDNIL